MPKSKESKHAALLLELGFERVVRNPTDRKIEIFTSSTNKPASELRGTEKMSASATFASLALARNELPEVPIYMNVGGLVSHTFVMDEHGNLWIANEIIDLSAWDFTNALELLGEFGEQKRKRAP